MKTGTYYMLHITSLVILLDTRESGGSNPLICKDLRLLRYRSQ